ncbi:MAG: NADH-quinone oxidoreductase subunit C [Candidatus Hadarchaeales archaeon]
MRAEELLEEIKQKFGEIFLEGGLKPHLGANPRIFVRVSKERILDAAKKMVEMGYRLCTVSCVEHMSFFELIYHFSLDQEKVLANLRIEVPKSSPRVDSITSATKGALFIEREIHDLFGVEFVGHPDLRRLILADDWPKEVFPLRKG